MYGTGLAFTNLGVASGFRVSLAFIPTNLPRSNADNGERTNTNPARAVINYASAKDYSTAAACGFTIPNTLMCKWHWDNLRGSELTKALYKAIPNHCLAVRENCDRFYELLRKCCSSIASRCNSAKGCEERFILHSSTTVHAQKCKLTSYDDCVQLLAEFESITLTRNGQEQEIDRLYEEIKQLGTFRNLGSINGKLSPRPAERKLGQRMQVPVIHYLPFITYWRVEQFQSLTTSTDPSSGACITVSISADEKISTTLIIICC